MIFIYVQIHRIVLRLGSAPVSINTIIPSFFATNHPLKRQNHAYQTFLGVLFPISFATHEQVPVQDGGA